MRLMTCRDSRAPSLHGLSGLALLLLLAGCASQPSWVSAGHNLVEVDFEAPRSSRSSTCASAASSCPMSRQAPLTPEHTATSLIDA